MIIAGHGRREALLTLGHSHAPTIMVTGLSEAQKIALMIADNKITCRGRDDLPLLVSAIESIKLDETFDLTLTGFEIPEIDNLLFEHEADSRDPADETEPEPSAVSKRGDVGVQSASDHLR